MQPLPTYQPGILQAVGAHQATEDVKFEHALGRRIIIADAVFITFDLTVCYQEELQPAREWPIESEGCA